MNEWTQPQPRRSRSRRGSWSRQRYSYFTNMQKRTKLHGQTASSQRASTHTHTQRRTRILSRRASVWESARERVKVKFTATATTPAPRLFVLLRTRCVRDERWKSTEFAGKHTAAARLRRRLWLNLLDEQLSAATAAATATQPRRLQFFWGLLWLLIVLASRRVDHYLSAAQLHYELCACDCVCARECEADDKFLISASWKISRLSIKLFNLPNENASSIDIAAELCTLCCAATLLRCCSAALPLSWSLSASIEP